MTAAGCALFAASAMGAATVSESFESQTAGDPIANGSTWTGYGTVTATNYTAAGDSSVGRPIVQASGNPANVLAVEGRVTRTAATTASNAATVDMMVQIALPDDDLAFPSGTDTTDIQIAVGVDRVSGSDTTGALKVWCQPPAPAGGTAGWVSLGKTYDKDSWHRVSFTFDYANKLCQIRVDGEPVITDNGVYAAGSNVAGSWYKLANGSASSALASVQIIGSTSIDDLLVSEAAQVADALPVLADAAGETNGVSYAWIEQQGVTRDTTAHAPDYATSGMTVGQKYAAGYDVNDNKKFGVKSMSMSGTSATITFDQAAVKSGYTYVLSTSTDNDTWSDATTITSGEAAAGSKTIDLGDAAVKYLKLKVVTTPAN